MEQTEEKVNLYAMTEEELDIYEQTLINEKLTLEAVLEGNQGDSKSVQMQLNAIELELKRVEEVEETRFRDMESQMGMRC